MPKSIDMLMKRVSCLADGGLYGQRERWVALVAPPDFLGCFSDEAIPLRQVAHITICISQDYFAAEMPWWKILWLAVLAGIYLSFGGALLYFVGGQVPAISASVCHICRRPFHLGVFIFDWEDHSTCSTCFACKDLTGSLWVYVRGHRNLKWQTVF